MYLDSSCSWKFFWRKRNKCLSHSFVECLLDPVKIYLPLLFFHKPLFSILLWQSGCVIKTHLIASVDNILLNLHKSSHPTQHYSILLLWNLLYKQQVQSIIKSAQDHKTKTDYQRCRTKILLHRLREHLAIMMINWRTMSASMASAVRKVRVKFYITNSMYIS